VVKIISLFDKDKVDAWGIRVLHSLGRNVSDVGRFEAQCPKWMVSKPRPPEPFRGQALPARGGGIPR